MTSPEQDTRRRRLLFRAMHRGTHENDILIGGFVRENLGGMTDSELDALERVLDLPDPDLSDWLCGRVAVPPEMEHPMLRRMIRSALRA